MRVTYSSMAKDQCNATCSVGQPLVRRATSVVVCTPRTVARSSIRSPLLYFEGQQLCSTAVGYNISDTATPCPYSGKRAQFFCI